MDLDTLPHHRLLEVVFHRHAGNGSLEPICIKAASSYREGVAQYDASSLVLIPVSAAA